MFLIKSNKNYARIIDCADGGDKFGIIAINGKLRSAIINNLEINYATQGSYVKTGGVLSEHCVPSLLFGGIGALGTTAATSGSLFIATANTDTLMTIGGGVGSAVMGATGKIVGQAPFVAVSGALMPVTAPLLAFQALSSVMLMQQFAAVNEQLNQMRHEVSRILQRNEATFIGELISSASKLSAIEQEYNIAHRFSNDMAMRLALIENKINPHFERYRYLYQSRSIDGTIKADELRVKNSDAYIATLLSVLDLQTDLLRLKLTLQENPAFLSTLSSNLIRKTEQYQSFWGCVENNPSQVEELTQTFQRTLSAMNGWQKLMPQWLGGKRDMRTSTERAKSSLDEVNTRSNTKNMVETAKAAQSIGKSITDSIGQASLLYWEDRSGKHSYYTHDVIIK